MKYGLIFIAFITSSAFSYTRQIITIKEIGLSLNTERVFVIPDQKISNSPCSEKQYLSIALPSPEAYLFYSTALTAMNEDKGMRIQYSNTECVKNGTKVEVFWNLNQ